MIERRSATSWRAWSLDMAVAAALVLLSMRVLASAAPSPGFRTPDLTSYLLTATGVASLGWGRHLPLPALVWASVASTVLAVRNDHTDVLPFVVTALLFAAGSYLPRRPAIFALLVVGLGLAVSTASRPADLGAAAVVQTAGIFAVAWTLGRLTRGRREALLALVAAAEEHAHAERDRAALSRVEERLRIARELHDVLAHSVSVISVQATVGEHLASQDAATAQRSLATIGELSRSSMRELRQMLTLLREDSDQVIPTTAPYGPAHVLADLTELVGTYETAGLTVKLANDGEVRELSASAQLCAYRIVQEALTNTLKHAGPTAACITLTYTSDALLLTIADGGLTAGGREVAPAPERGAGHGLVGMRERTAVLGGSLTAGPAPTGGFVVTATIPYEQA